MIDNLKAFNRKERYFLVKAALGSFQLSSDYRDMLGKSLGFSISEDAFVAMDYHLTWLYASIFLAAEGTTLGQAVSKPFSNVGGHVRGNQEDIDLLVAFDESDVTHVIAVEAKGVTGWTNSQLQSKADRLMAIFGDAGAEHANVKPHFVLTSPKESAGIDVSKWPAWMRPGKRAAWIPLSVPGSLFRVSRADEHGRAAANAGYWTVLPEQKGSVSE